MTVFAEAGIFNLPQYNDDVTAYLLELTFSMTTRDVNLYVISVVDSKVLFTWLAVVLAITMQYTIRRCSRRNLWFYPLVHFYTNGNI